ncbi:IS607 family element RNA-guided endonuclease TnpB (plasmid) [Curtobacterium sp. MCBD17_040]|nr:IS607 family element RNA-guided endonuclease TnpB [Curtobacterium sp. MCBD17_040]WIB65977.1 IS607 family element RNA-guided endonuclease TnpB [Curtobacterium sp. MCBD17_040]
MREATAPGGAGSHQRAYRFALDPTPAQVRALLSHAGAARVAFNTMLAVVRANLDQRTAERSYGIPDVELTPSLSWSKVSLRNGWVARRDTVAPWWPENAREAYTSGCFALAAALDNWSKSRSGTRAGAPVGFPRFKSRARSKPSIKFEGKGALVPTGHTIHLPRIGKVHTHESTRKLGRLVEAGQAKVNSVTVSYDRGRWFAAFQVEQVAIVRPRPLGPKSVVGIDVGVKDLIVVARPDGSEVERLRAPKDLAKAAATLKALQRQAARQVGPYDVVSKRRQQPSAGWLRTQARIRKVHARVANLRADRLHKLTTRLAREFDVVGIEHLNVRGMLARAKPKPHPSRPGVFLPNRRRQKSGLARSVANASFSTLHQQLQYKTSWFGSTLVRADRFYPSSKTCSGCGSVKAKLTLAEREYVCTTCGMVIDRDLNAAVNLARHAAASVAEESGPDEGSSFVSGGGTQKPQPAAAGTGRSQRNRNPTSTTGTPSPQGQGSTQPSETSLTPVEN